MLSIQEVGTQVLTGNPMPFYVFVGNEYGIKEKYLENISNHYQISVEVNNMSDIIELMSKKHIVPLKPTLYIVRYDEDFLRGLDKKSNDRMKAIEKKFIGTVVCIFELQKHSDKCTKYLPDFTVSFDSISPEFIKKYLKSDFPNMDSSVIDFAVQLRNDYKGAHNICASLSHADPDVLMKYDGNALADVLGSNFSTSEKQFRYGVASRNFAYCLSVIDNYNGQLDMLLYTFLSTMIDIEKGITNPKQQSDLKKWSSQWNVSDVYHMFMNVYSELEKSRILSTYNVYAGLLYLIGLLQYSPIPEVGAL